MSCAKACRPVVGCGFNRLIARCHRARTGLGSGGGNVAENIRHVSRLLFRFDLLRGRQRVLGAADVFLETERKDCCRVQSRGA